MVEVSPELPRKQGNCHCQRTSQRRNRHLSGVRVGLEVSLAHGMGSWRLHTGHPKHMVWLRQAGLLPSHGETKTEGNTHLYLTQKEGCEDPPCCWEPKRAQGMRRSYRATN